MRLAEHVERTGKEEEYTGFWLGNLQERDHLEDPYVDGNIILKGSYINTTEEHDLYLSGSG